MLACKTECRDALDLELLSSVTEGMKVSSPEHSGAVRYVRLPPASPRTAHPSLKIRIVHRSRNYAYTGRLRFTGNHSSFVDFQQCRASLQPAQARQGGSASFSGRPSQACSQHKLDRAAQQASVVALLARDSISQRASCD